MVGSIGVYVRWSENNHEWKRWINGQQVHNQKQISSMSNFNLAILVIQSIENHSFTVNQTGNSSTSIHLQNCYLFTYQEREEVNEKAWNESLSWCSFKLLLLPNQRVTKSTTNDWWTFLRPTHQRGGQNQFDKHAYSDIHEGNVFSGEQECA